MALKKMFQKYFKNSSNQDIDDNSSKLSFEQDVLEVAKRYSHNNGYTLENLKEETKINILFADYFTKEFGEWLEIKAPRDQRRLIYSILDQFFFDKVKLWEKAERFIESRLPLKAYDIFQKANQPEEDLEMYYSTYAKVYIILHEYDKAIEEIIKGLAKYPDSIHLKIQLADYYYSISSMNRYNEVIKELTQNIPKNPSSDMNVIFDDFFSYSKGKIRSFAFAVNLGFSLADPEQIKVFWERALDEFYFHPVFRLDDARYMLDNTSKDDLVNLSKVFAKYYFLLKEMPWQKEAAINALSLTKPLKIKDERYDFIKKIIADNKWNDK